MHQPDKKTLRDPLAEIARLARMESAPRTDVSMNVLRQIRVQHTILAERPLMWMALGSTAAAVAIAIVSMPVFMSLLDPLNALFQSTPTSLL